MRPDLLAYIRQLSLADKKNLSQKNLKLMEEAGELAKAILPFDDAHGTTHRFVKREKVLEEAVDSLLVSLSIAYSLGYDDEAIASMVKRKSDFWAELQAREAKVPELIPYELHVTVAQAPDLDAFKRSCAALEVKPVVLDLHLKTKGVIKDVMTSSVFFGRNAQALARLEDVAQGLASEGYEVVRQKIETVPWHPAAPSRAHANPVMPAGCYFESHLAVQAQDSLASLGLLQRLAKEQGCHLSGNVFKRDEQGFVTMMATRRAYEGVYEDFVESVGQVRHELIQYGYAVEKEIVEFSIYDSRMEHDAAWLA